MDHVSSPTSALLADFGGTSGTVAGMNYDAVGNRTGYVASGFPAGTGTLNGTTTYAYDARNELTSEITTRYYSSATSNPYQYDGVTTGTTTGCGNGTSIKGEAFAYDTKADNQIASDGLSNTYGYDGSGNPTTYKSTSLTFDPENRTTAYASSLTAAYNGDNLRAWKQNGSGNRTYFLYDGDCLLAELSGAGNFSGYQTWGGNGLLSRYTSSVDYFYTYDATGSVATVSSSTGIVQGNEIYDVTGKRLTSFASSPVSFCGQWGYYEDVEMGLILCGHRYYDSYTARFINRDPFGFDGGVNLYDYCTNNEVNYTDALGYTGSSILNPYKRDKCEEQREAELALIPTECGWEKDVAYQQCVSEFMKKIRQCATSNYGHRLQCVNRAERERDNKCPIVGHQAYQACADRLSEEALRGYDRCKHIPYHPDCDVDQRE